MYHNNPEKIGNDIIMAMILATDTSRNTVITSLSHLAKDKLSTEKVRAEVESFLNARDMKNPLEIVCKDLQDQELF